MVRLMCQFRRCTWIFTPGKVYPGSCGFIVRPMKLYGGKALPMNTWKDMTCWPAQNPQAFRPLWSAVSLRLKRSSAPIRNIRSLRISKNRLLTAIHSNVSLRRRTSPIRSYSELDCLTEREREVFDLLAKGMTNKEIADVLVITTNTVKRHLKAIFEKLGVHTRSAAAAKAVTG